MLQHLMHFTSSVLEVLSVTFFLISWARTCASSMCDLRISPTRNRRQYSPSLRHITAFRENRSVVLRFFERASFANIRPTYGQERKVLKFVFQNLGNRSLKSTLWTCLCNYNTCIQISTPHRLERGVSVNSC